MNHNNIDKEKTVVALQFDGISTPRVTAKGTGSTGEYIIQIAQQHGIPLHENSALAKALSRIPLGEEIPQQLFCAVAEVLAFIYFLDETHTLTRNHHQ